LIEYLKYIDIMMYGNDEERNKQSFELMDTEGNGQVNFPAFKALIGSFA
jgi:hypothetical protein